MSSLDALVEVLETLMPEEVERQFEEEAKSENGPMQSSADVVLPPANLDDCYGSCFESCCNKQPRESRLDLLIDALRQQMPPTVKKLIQQEQDRLDEELMECREELPDSSTSSLVSSIEDNDDDDEVYDEDEEEDEVDSELGWSPHDDEFPVLENASGSELQEPSNEDKSTEETDESYRGTPDVLDRDDVEAESAIFDSRSAISCAIGSPDRDFPASTTFSTAEILDECRKRRGSGARPFRCHVCNCGFGHKSTLRNHYRIHTGERPHRCCVCLKTFSQIGNLKRHLAQHANLALSCPRCGVIFAFGHLLQVHLRSCRKQTQSHARQSNRLASGYKTLTNNYKSTVSSSTSPDTVVAAIRKDAEPRGTTDTSSRPSPTPEDSSVAEVTTAWPSEKPGKQVKLWTMYPCPHCDKVLTWQYDLRQHMESHRRLRYFKGSKRTETAVSRSNSGCSDNASLVNGGCVESSGTVETNSNRNRMASL